MLRESDIGKSRSQASLRRLQDLNYFVSVDVCDDAITVDNLPVLDGYTVVIFTDATLEIAQAINKYCRSRGILFILAGILGTFGHVFVDFCDTFEVHDKDGNIM